MNGIWQPMILTCLTISKKFQQNLHLTEMSCFVELLFSQNKSVNFLSTPEEFPLSSLLSKLYNQDKNIIENLDRTEQSLFLF